MTERQPVKWQPVVEARRLFARGYGWWEIWLACGHGAAVLHGGSSPIGESVKCLRCAEAAALATNRRGDEA
jgi:hypothetical protein